MAVPGLPPGKRPRTGGIGGGSGKQEEEVVQVPREVVARIQRCLQAQPAGASVGSFQLLSWNIDGLDEHGPRDTMLRALAVAEHVAATQPVVVFLQEAIPPQLELFSAPQTIGGLYDIVCAESPRLPYYCAMLLHKRRVKLLGPPRTRHFAASKMGRHILSADIVVDGRETDPVAMFTTHLESMKTERDERVKQLTEGLQVMVEASRALPRKRSVILAGDLNARDDEVLAARKKAKVMSPEGVDGIVDAWTWCGSPKTHEYTWDTSSNDNCGAAYAARCRFDRCLFMTPGVTDGKGEAAGARRGIAKSSATPASASRGSAGSGSWRATGFELVGRSRVEGLRRFPSDHYGLQVTFSLGEGASPSQPSASSAAVAPASAPLAAGAAAVSLASGLAGNGSGLIGRLLGGGGGTSPSSTDDAAGQSASTRSADEERRLRREFAAKQAEARLREHAARGLGDGKSSKDSAAVAAAAVAASRARASAAVPEPRVAPALAAACAGASGRGDGAGAAAAAGQGDDDEDEDATLARAIALSLQGAVAPAVSPSIPAATAAPAVPEASVTAAAGPRRSAFARLLGAHVGGLAGGAAGAEAQRVIDLE